MEPLKEQFFKLDFIDKLAKEAGNEARSFDKAGFLEAIKSGPWVELELMDRMRRITDCLQDSLPRDYPEALAIIRKVASKFEGFDSLVFPDFVRRYGVEYPEDSVPALEQFTELCSSEFAVRPFIERYPEILFPQLKRWARSKNMHHRRLASEGCRPRLPWASALKTLKKDPSPIFPILEILKSDSEDYVRRSVANNLNDISKDHPELVVELVKSWQGISAETTWILKHGCRTLLKQGRPDVMELFGFTSPVSISGSDLKINKKRARVGDEISFHCILETNKGELGKLRLEYVVHFMKANGKPSPKVFQISERVETQSQIEVTKRHAFKDLSTRKHFPGTHQIELRVNGVCKSVGRVELFR